jgi:hypothetical protein
MKRPLLALVIAAGCGTLTETTEEDLSAKHYLVAEAELENGLPYDGCTWLVTIGDVDYAPSAASRAVIEAHTGNIGITKAKIRYRLTGADGVVDCGWNTTQTLPEIEIASIHE